MGRNMARCINLQFHPTSACLVLVVQWTDKCVHRHDTDAASTADKIAHLPYVSKCGWVRHAALSINLVNKWWNNKMWHSFWMLLCYILQAVITVLVAEINWCCQQYLCMLDSGPTAIPDVTKSDFVSFSDFYYSNGTAWKIIDWWLKCLLIFFIANSEACCFLSCFSIFPLVKQWQCY